VELYVIRQLLRYSAFCSVILCIPVESQLEKNGRSDIELCILLGTIRSRTFCLVGVEKLKN
jgi:hypothetical protein